jgi:ATP-dependent protease HslVU (ClpYQ) peptidase subunit
MTCIVAEVDHDGNVCMGGDSAAVSDYDILTTTAPKVFRKGDFIFGFAGHFRFGQILQYSLKCPRVKGDVNEFLVNTFANRLRETVKDVGYSRAKEGRDEGGCALVAVAGRLFMMADEFEFIEARDGLAALGCGSSYALGSLKTNRIGTVQQRIEQALEVSEYYCAGVRAPFTILTLEGPHVRGNKHSRGNRKLAAGVPKHHA